ncbi:DUF177 domain-containing protein [Fulvivirgaceae bacterium BMA10]|uniref:DUF177 domain-containing protein n=1 Tax=Splendidivirga corallicola TaxID=3051826 RepID=A0ABT8KTI1_9BACT|nr:DUF177 domain-containing protein [Fulvivirgaceae bacterium BMA10]
MVKKDIKEFEIDIFSLKNSTHEYRFEVKDSFFTLFEGGLVEKGNISVDLILDKTETLINMTFELKGSIELVCDRSLEPFDYPIDLNENLIFKFGEEEKELDEHISIISRDKENINVAQFIYEFIGLAVPMKKLHPKFEESEIDEEGQIVYSSDEDSNDENIDPRWKQLKNLRNN